MMEESSESTTKRRKVSGEEETVTMIDRISTLPDCVLCHILSFLPTKLAVATSILSNRWRSLWTLVPALDFKIRDFEIGMLVHMKFACIVYKILILTCPQSIKKLRLHYWIPSFDSDTSHLTSWFCTAVERKVEQIELVLSLKKGTFELPATLFTCKTIVSLTLAGNITLNVPPSVNFPSLKKLLFLELIYSDDALEILLSGCPVLEVLFVESKFDVKWKTRLVTLKILSVEFSNNRDVPQILDVSVSSLKYFALTGSIYGDSYHIRHLDSLAVAELNVSADEGETCNLVRLLGNLRHTKILSLSSTTVESLHGGASSLALPEFPKLERLELTLQSSDLNLVENLLQKCHKVEVLVIEKIDTCVNELCWKQPISVPDWLSSRLIMCKFRGYQGSKSELEFVKYVLKSASILRRMTIHLSSCLESEAKLKILNELSMVPIGSSTCELLLD